MKASSLSTRTLFIIVIAGIAMIGGGLLIGQTMPSFFPPEASAQSQQIDALFKVLLVIGGAIFLLVEGLLLYSVIAFRAKPGDTADGPHIHGNTTLEIVWTAIPAVIVTVITILSYNVWVSIRAEQPDEAVVNVVGARFNWAFTYNVASNELPADTVVTDLPQSVQDKLNQDGAVQVTANELHTYIGQSLKLEMETRDVIHSFWVPAFRMKQDLLTGRVTEIRFTPVEVPDNTDYPVRYPIRCAELCGGNHGAMISWVVVHKDEAAFKAEFLDTAVAKVLHPPEDPVLRGSDLLSSQQYPCFTCHTLSEFGWTANIGPSLDGVADRAAGIRSQATGLSATDYLLQSIHDPSAYLVPGFGPLMPNLNIPDDQAQDIVAFLCTLSETGESTCG
ncbi:MAG: cytochrome c oxidase subunit II [Anaerolineaceae bacterium]|nr:cytochrome c oxidase subunit II [Anaerolineaceae bacterium]